MRFGAAYIDPLEVRRHVRAPSATTMLQVTEPFSVVVGDRDRAEYLTVPRGTLTNSTSFPSLFGVTGDRLDAGFEAAVVHDYLYVPAGIRKYGYSRKEADQIYLALLLASGLPRWRCYARYAAARARGWRHWNRR